MSMYIPGWESSWGPVVSGLVVLGQVPGAENQNSAAQGRVLRNLAGGPSSAQKHLRHLEATLVSTV